MSGKSLFNDRLSGGFQLCHDLVYRFTALFRWRLATIVFFDFFLDRGDHIGLSRIFHDVSDQFIPLLLGICLRAIVGKCRTSSETGNQQRGAGQYQDIYSHSFLNGGRTASPMEPSQKRCAKAISHFDATRFKIWLDGTRSALCSNRCRQIGGTLPGCNGDIVIGAPFARTTAPILAKPQD